MVGNLPVSVEALIIDVIAEGIGQGSPLKHKQKSCRSLELCLMALMKLCVRSHHYLLYSNETARSKGIFFERNNFG